MATHEALLYDSPEAFEEYCARIAARLASRQQERMVFLRGCEARLLELRSTAELLDMGGVISELQEHLNTIKSELSDTERLPVAGEAEPAYPSGDLAHAGAARASGAPAHGGPAPKEPAPPWPALPAEESGLLPVPPEPALAEAASLPDFDLSGVPPAPEAPGPEPKSTRSPKGSAPVEPPPLVEQDKLEAAAPPPAPDTTEPEPKWTRATKGSAPVEPPPVAEHDKLAAATAAAEADPGIIGEPVFSALEGSRLAGFPEPELPGDRAGATWGLTWIPPSVREPAPSDESAPAQAATGTSPFDTPPKAAAPKAPAPESAPPDVTQVVAAPRPASPSLRVAHTGMMDWDLSHIRGAAQGSVSVEVPGAAPLRLEIQVGERRWEWTHQGGVAVIGRRDPHGPSAPDVDLWPDGGVSRGHAQIALRDGAYYLTDLGSTNGTQINGNGLVPRTEVLLNDGDEILIGEESTLWVRI